MTVFYNLTQIVIYVKLEQPEQLDTTVYELCKMCKDEKSGDQKLPVQTPLNCAANQTNEILYLN